MTAKMKSGLAPLSKGPTPVAKKPGPKLYFNMEMTQAQVKRRLEQAGFIIGDVRL